MYYLPFKLLYLNFILGVYLVCCENLGWNEGGVMILLYSNAILKNYDSIILIYRIYKVKLLMLYIIKTHTSNL